MPWRALPVMCIALFASCARPQTRTPSPAPVITTIAPTGGPAGAAYPIMIVIEGRSFADSTNVVTFGPVTLRGISSSRGGTRLEFLAPKEIPARGEVPPAPLLPDVYDVTITTSAGTSNRVSFTLTREISAARAP